MAIVLVCILGCLVGFILFRKNVIPPSDTPLLQDPKLSIIIPARNEQENLPYLLRSLQLQTLQPYEVIVVDDFSEDETKAIAESFGVTVVANSSLPPGWTGKNWAVWNGYQQATGDLIAFLDADIRFAPRALELLVRAREASGGVVSVVPFHYTETFSERLALIFNVLGVFAFTSPFEKANPRQGLYGSCILTARDDYEAVKGHEGIRHEMLDDLNLGAAYRREGIPVTNYIGKDLVSFRMYPGGLRSAIQGFGKGAMLGTAKLRGGTTALIALWAIGLVLSCSFPFLLGTSWGLPLLIGYVLYMVQLFYFVNSIGIFGVAMPVLYVISTLFFLMVMGYSMFQVVFLGHVAWKGRQVKVGSRREL
ncbi:glycosyltransferase [Paenibacillus ferrarius]|uniref:glycosyltransferase n=1 Tax=Paenibacillus ferrarius TaxID=1469647 RepID=UPI003D2AA153